MMDLSIVIASYNTRDITRKCLEMVISQTSGLKYEIIVVDNASKDETVKMIASDFPQVVLVENKINLGFAAAQNIGLQKAKGQFLMILNSDVFFVGNPAFKMVEFFRGEKTNLGVVGPQVINLDGSIAPSARRAVLSRPIIALGVFNRHFPVKHYLPSQTVLRKYLGFILSRFHDNYAGHDTVCKVDFVDGMCAVIKREVLVQVGLFDEQFFFDWEIVDISNRIRAAGWEIAFLPDAQVVHAGGLSRRKLSRILVETHKGELIYYIRHAPELVSYVKNIVRIVVSLKRLTLKWRLWNSLPAEERVAAMDYCRQIIALTYNLNPGKANISPKIPILHS